MVVFAALLAAPHGSDSGRCRAEWRVTCICHLIRSTPLKKGAWEEPPSSTALQERLNSTTF